MIPNSIRRARMALAPLALLIGTSTLPARNWVSWRGPEQCGLSRETDLPETWSPEPEGKNLLWTQPQGSRSAPVVLLDRVYIINLAGEGEKRQERVTCFDAATGRVIWEHRFNVFLTDIPDRRVGWANPVADEETGYVYVHGVQGFLKCLDGKDGRVIWERSLTEEFGRISGYGGRTHTPVIDEDRLILSFLNSSWGSHGRGLHRYIALDKRTGSVIWWSAPGGAPLDTTYSCPVVTVVDGQRLLIGGNADGAVYALRARTGESVWKFSLSKRGLNSSVVARDSRVYVCHSEENIDRTEMGRVVCIDATGTGDVTKTHELWRAEGVTAGYSSPAMDDEHLYVIDNSANVLCYDIKSGKELWKHNVGTVMKASPVVVDGKLYIGSVNGLFSILRVSKDGCQTLSQQEFTTADGRIVELNGAPCVANGRLYFTTTLATYCIGKKDWQGKSLPFPAMPSESTTRPGSDPAYLQVIPADITLYPGQSTLLRARTFNAKGQLLDSCTPQDWVISNLEARVAKNGRLSTTPTGGFGSGIIEAHYKTLKAQVRVRIVPPIPLTINFDDIDVGTSPPGWIGATPVKFQVVEKDGSRVLTKLATNPKFLITNAYMGMSAWSDYTLMSDVMGTEKRRQRPNIGLLVHRYNLSIMGNTDRVRIVSWAPMKRVEEKVPFTFEPGAWYRMKLRVDRQGKDVLVRGKVWLRDQPEPEKWLVSLVDPSPNFGGSPGIHAYSAGTTDQSTGAEIYWDNITITPNK